jgi:hypothetical protein
VREHEEPKVGDRTPRLQPKVGRRPGSGRVQAGTGKGEAAPLRVDGSPLAQRLSGSAEAWPCLRPRTSSDLLGPDPRARLIIAASRIKKQGLTSCPTKHNPAQQQAEDRRRRMSTAYGRTACLSVPDRLPAPRSALHASASRVDGFRRPWSKSANNPLCRGLSQDDLEALNYLPISVLLTPMG